MQARLPITLSVAVLLLAGCAGSARVPGPGPITTLVLNQPISIPEGRARIYLQDGKLTRGVDEFTPSCGLEIRQVSGPPRTVPAGRYAVTRVQELSTEVVFNGVERQVARAGVSIGVGSGGFGIGIGIGSSGMDDGGDSPSDIFEGYHFWLADSARVGLMRLTCLGARAQPVDVEPPTRAEMARALGKWGRLE